MAWDLSTGAGVTALGLAAARSVESGRADRLIEDPFARKLFEAADAGLPMPLAWPDSDGEVSDTEALHLHGSRYIGVRTRFYDDALIAATGDGAEQAVLLGSGLDTRAFRLDLPAGLRLLELDQPGVLDHKAAVLATADPRCERVPIGIDLRDDWPTALTAAGFASERPTAWVAEGLLAYLPPDAQSALLTRVHALSAPGSALAFDRIAGNPRVGDRLRELSERSGVDMENLIAGGEAADLAGLLRERGWTVTEEAATTVAERYGRDLNDPFAGDDTRASAEPPWLDTVFVTSALPE